MNDLLLIKLSTINVSVIFNDFKVQLYEQYTCIRLRLEVIMTLSIIFQLNILVVSIIGGGT
jgi:hypothetical protein